MPDQTALSQQVEDCKRRVIALIGAKPAADFRSDPAYMAYTALCGEAFWARKNEELDEELVGMLAESAEKVIRAWQTRGTHAEN